MSAGQGLLIAWLLFVTVLAVLWVRLERRRRERRHLDELYDPEAGDSTEAIAESCARSLEASRWRR
jgi:hypothetical protein